MSGSLADVSGQLTNCVLDVKTIQPEITYQETVCDVVVQIRPG